MVQYLHEMVYNYLLYRWTAVKTKKPAICIKIQSWIIQKSQNSQEDILANRTLYVDSKTSRAHPRELFSFIIGYKIDQVDQVDENSEQSSSLQASFALAMWWTS